MEIQTKWFSDTAPLNAKKASTTIGAGADGVVTIQADAIGTEGNSYTVAVVNGISGGDLDSAINGSDITVTLGMTAAVAASTTIGTGADGVVAITADTAGVAGNAYTIAVAVGEGTLSADLTDGDLVVTLAAAGNTATEIASVINTAADGELTAVASGEGTGAITEAVVEKNLADGANTAADATKNTAAFISASVDALAGVTATASGEGTTAITETVTKKSLAGGQYGTIAPVPYTWLFIGSEYYTNIAPNGKYDANWRKATFATY